MNGDELTYKRIALDVNCRSTEIAYSFIEGRIDANERFELNGKQLSIKEIIANDEIVKAIILEKIGADGVNHRLFPLNKFNSFSERYKLFKKIVLHGNDSLLFFILQIEKLNKNNATLQAEKEELDKKLDFCTVQRNYLTQTNAKTLENLGDLLIILQGLKNNFSDCENSITYQYSKLLQMEESAITSVKQALQENCDKFNQVIDEKNQEKIKAVDIISTLHKENEKNIEDRKKYLQDYVSQQEKELLENKEKTIQEIDNLKQAAVKEIEKKNQLLSTSMSKAGDFYSTIYKNKANLFKENPNVYSSPKIPNKKLFTAIQKCNGEIAPCNVIAMYDSSSSKNGSSGILVSYHAFYIFGDFTTKKYLLNSYNKISIAPPQKHGFIGSIIKVLFSDGTTTKTINLQNSTIATLNVKNSESFDKFVEDLNCLLSSCNWTSNQIAEIEKIDFDSSSIKVPTKK